MADVDEIADKITDSIIDRIMIQYCDDPDRGIRVAEIVGRLSQFLTKEFPHPTEAYEAVTWMALIIKETKKVIEEKHESKR